MGLTLCDQSVQSVKGIAKNSRPNNKRSRNSEFHAGTVFLCLVIRDLDLLTPK